MNLLPPGLGGTALLAWRLDQANFAPTWDSGEGAYRVGGRWNSPGRRAVYCSLDPATAILEVAVHKGFRALDAVAHVMTAIEIVSATDIRVVSPDEVPDPDWLVPGIPKPAQQAFADRLLEQHAFVALPSVVSRRSWNLVFIAQPAAGKYALTVQEAFVLDPRLHVAAGR